MKITRKTKRIAAAGLAVTAWLVGAVAFGIDSTSAANAPAGQVAPVAGTADGAEVLTAHGSAT